jgi:hypothetical protein
MKIGGIQGSTVRPAEKDGVLAVGGCPVGCIVIEVWNAP